MKAARQPFMKWYPSDWRADPALRMCSLAARGLWIELIGFMHEGEPYGYLTITGLTPAIDDIAALVGRPIAEVRKALTELEQRQVFSKEGDLIYSRRMVRDKAKAEQDRANGKGGGNPKLRGEVNGGVNPPDKAQIPEARDQKTESVNCADAKAPRTKLEYSHEFEAEFWQPYPRSQTMSKKEAWREWMKLDPGDREAACKAIEPYRKFLRAKPNLETVHACRFLSQRRFEGFFEAQPAPQSDIRASIV